MTENSSYRWARAEDGIIGGVCLGLARQLQVDPWIVRILWLLAVLFFGTGVLAYFICVFALPRTDRLNKAYDRKILGVCSRVARRTNIEVGLVRLLALAFLVTTCGAALLAYVVLHFLLKDSYIRTETSSRSLI